VGVRWLKEEASFLKMVSQKEVVFKFILFISRPKQNIAATQKQMSLEVENRES